MRYLLAVLAILLPVVGGAPAVAADVGPPPPGFLLRSTDLYADRLDPQSVKTIAEGELAVDLYEGLTRQGRGGVVEPGLAEGWSVSADGLRWTFTLRPGTRWSDGTPLTAADVAASLARALEPAVMGPASKALVPIRGATERLAGADGTKVPFGVSAPDPRTMAIELVMPAPHLPEILAQPMAVAVAGADSPVLRGAGPFRLLRWDPTGDVVLERNPHYHDAAQVRLDGVVYRRRASPGDAYNQLLRSELDIAPVPVDRAEGAAVQATHRIVRKPEFATTLLFPNHRTGPLAGRPDLRRALLLSLDRAGLLALIASEQQEVAYGIVPPGIPTFPPLPAESRSRAALDAAARDLLRQALAPGESPPRLRIDYLESRTNRRMLEAIKARWQTVLGLEVEFQGHEPDALFARIGAGDFHLILLTAYGLVRQPSEFLEAFAAVGGPANFGGYNDPVFEDLLATALRSVEAEGRLSAFRAAERRLLDQAAALPIDHPVTSVALSARVEGWPEPANSVVPSRLLSLRGGVGVTPGTASNR